MGQKVNPISARIGINRLWDSRWFARKKRYVQYLHQDIAVEKFLRARLKDAGLSRIEIHRSVKQVTVTIYTSRPGIVIGSQGKSIDELKEVLHKKFGENFGVTVKEIKRPYLDAAIVAENVGRQIERRIPYRRACKMTVERAMEAGAQGIKINVAGRLNGVEISRSEFFTDGKIPLHTFRSDIDYAQFPAATTYGVIGVKVWVYKGDIFKKDMLIEAETN